MEPTRSAFPGFDVARAGMRAQMKRAEVVAANLANMHVTRTATGEPYRRRTVVFEELLAEGDTGSGVQVAEVREDHETPFIETWNPGHPHANADGFVLLPNVDLFAEMVDLSVAARAFEANLAAMRVYRGMLEDTLATFR